MVQYKYVNLSYKRTQLYLINGKKIFGSYLTTDKSTVKPNLSHVYNYNNNSNHP